MGAIASVLAAMGHEVSGSDLKEGLIVERLRAEGIAVAIGHKAENVAEAELVAISSAIPDHNPELIAARRLGMEVLRRMDLLPAISEQRRTVAVAGTHGKTTTSSMLSMVLTEAGFQPSFIIGGDINEIGSGAVWGAGEWMVIEADESDRTFLSLGPEIAVITNIEPDHLETYGGEPSALHDAFVEFGDGAANCVMCADDPDGFALAQRLGAVTYGTTSAADYQLVEIVKSRASVSFSLKHLGEDVVSVDLPTPGLHNALNAAAAVVVALQLGAPADAASRASVAIRRSGSPLRIPGGSLRSHVCGRLCAPAGGGSGCLGRSRRRQLEADRGRVPTPSLQSDRHAGPGLRRCFPTSR